MAVCCAPCEYPAMMFSTGDEVEVTSDEEGFRGAWYEAKVARFMPRADRYTVVYDRLLTDDDPDDPRPLRETVDAVNVRPRPPHLREPFAVHCPVDAWYNDGWWVGVLAAVVRRGAGGKKPVRYAVCFPNSREKMEFGVADLRLHLEWVDNEWVKPDQIDQGSAVMAHPVGTQVEVSYCVKDLLNAWFSATVEKHIWKNNLLVKYHTMRANNRRWLMKEIVDVEHVRPCPPPESRSRNFGLLEDVEVFFNDGWCMGVITNISAGRTYIVKSQHWDGEKEFHQNTMRARLEWTDGCWALATKGYLTVLFEKGVKVEVSSEDEGFLGAWFAATIIELLDGNVYMVEYEAIETDDKSELLKETVDKIHIRPVPPNTEVRRFKFLEEVDAFYNDGWWIGVISKVLDGSRYNVFFKYTWEELEFAHSALRPHLDWINGKWISISQGLSL